MRLTLRARMPRRKRETLRNRLALPRAEGTEAAQGGGPLVQRYLEEQEARLDDGALAVSALSALRSSDRGRIREIDHENIVDRRTILIVPSVDGGTEAPLRQCSAVTPDGNPPFARGAV